MCFSATASFAASGALAAIGAATYVKAEKRERVVALFPLLFAIQQFVEGLQWLAIGSGAPNVCLGYTYLSFAYIFWPIFVPAAVYFLERDPVRKKILTWFIAAGAIVSLVLLRNMTQGALQIHHLSLGIQYIIPSMYSLVKVAAYLIVTCGSLLVSRRRAVQIAGAVLLAFAGISGWIFQSTFTSTWCFFAAVLSILLYFIVDHKKSMAA